MIVAGTPAPVAFFAYPDKPSCLVPDGALTQVLAEVGQDAVGALTALADLVAPGHGPAVTRSDRPAIPAGPLTVETWPAVIGALLPEHAILVDETISSGMGVRAFGVPGSRATTAEEFAEQLSQALAEPGPHLIEVIIPPIT